MRLGIRGKLLIFAAAVWAVIFGVYSIYIYHERIEHTRRMALNTATILSREIMADKQLYTSIVVPRAMRGGIAAVDAFHEQEDTIPLPLTFVREVSRSIGIEGGYRMSIISAEPINPKSAPTDYFQKNALVSLYKAGSTSHHSFEKVEGLESVRFMVPDIATSQGCVDCHNASPMSPRHDYKIGDVMGALEIIIPIEAELRVAMADVWRSIGYGFIVIVTMGLAGLAFIRMVVINPLGSLVDTTQRLSVGDLTGIAPRKHNDEIGDLAVQTNQVVENLSTMIEEMRRSTSEAAAISERVREVSSHVLDGSNRQGSQLDSIGANVEGINTSIVEIANSTEVLAASLEKGSISVHELGSSITEVVDNMESLFLSVDETATSTRDMSYSIRETSESIENLSAAVVQVTSSMAEISARIREVETNASEASKFADTVIKDARAGMEAVDSTRQGMARIKEVTRESSVIIGSLRERIGEVGKILDVIRDVAEETNLLALNAAIIAAQSGEHGKSFAVVANEIKDLAERTSTSAKEVSEIIQAVDSESDKAGRAMDRGLESVTQGEKLSVAATEGLRKIVESAERSTTSVREIARASADQSRESRMVVESTERVAEMTSRIVNATKEQARGAELIDRASDRMAEIARKVKGSTWSQVEFSKQIALTIEDVRGLVTHLNTVVREQSRNTAKVLEAIAAVRKVSVVNTDKAVEADRAAEELASLNRALLDSVRRFRLKR